MSYELRLMPEARRVLNELPLDVQEELWDLLDRVVADPHSPGTAAVADVHEFRYVAESATLSVYFALIIDDTKHIASVPVIEYIYW